MLCHLINSYCYFYHLDYLVVLEGAGVGKRTTAATNDIPETSPDFIVGAATGILQLKDVLEHPPKITKVYCRKQHHYKSKATTSSGTASNISSPDDEKENSTPKQGDNQPTFVTDTKNIDASFGTEDSPSDTEREEDNNSGSSGLKRKPDPPAMQEPQKTSPPVVQEPQKTSPPVVQEPQKKSPPVMQEPQKTSPPVVQEPQKKKMTNYFDKAATSTQGTTSSRTTSTTSKPHTSKPQPQKKRNNKQASLFSFGEASSSNPKPKKKKSEDKPKKKMKTITAYSLWKADNSDRTDVNYGNFTTMINLGIRKAYEARAANGGKKHASVASFLGR